MGACARRLVLNGLTAEELCAEGEAGGGGHSPPDSLEFYHELEVYRQLVALPPASPRRARTPSPARVSLGADPPTRRARTPGPSAGTPPAAPAPPHPPATRPARYLGSFPVCGTGGGGGGGGVDAREHLTQQLTLIKDESPFTHEPTGIKRSASGNHILQDIKNLHAGTSSTQNQHESGRAVPVLVVVALCGVRVCDPTDQSVRMSYALRRILYATCESVRALFAVVAREPRANPARTYCHAFETDTSAQAEELSALLGDAFRMAFASQLHPSAPLWSGEVSARAPDSLPLPHFTHHHNRSGAQCEVGVGGVVSPSSSEESTSPVEVCSYRRLGERAPLMRRLARGLTHLAPTDDDDSTPLVADTPTTPTNPLCLNGGYINEASEAEARTRESNRELPVLLPHTPRRCDNTHNTHDADHFRRCTNNKNSGGSGACSRTTSSSSGASSCGGGSHGSGNNNVPRHEPELRHAPWFQHGIPREIALEVLSAQPVGAFLVRGSTTQAGCFALSVRVPRDFTPCGIAHYLILRTPKGYKIKGFTKEFRSLCALVTHHSVMPELLPVPLLLPPAHPRAPRTELADIDALAPPPPHPPHSATHTPRHLPNFLAQLDV